MVERLLRSLNPVRATEELKLRCPFVAITIENAVSYPLGIGRASDQWVASVAVKNVQVIIIAAVHG
jgi:hypothetical protein